MTDALAYAVDVLVLKYAQATYGLDETVVKLTGFDRALLPPVGGHRICPAAGAIAAETVVFVGVPPIGAFGYAEIREFGREALSVATRAAPTATSVAMTLHGAGFGLDEVEAFQAELAGVFEAVAESDVPPALERVVFLELSPDRARRMAGVLANTMPRGGWAPGLPLGSALPSAPAERLRTVGYDSSAKPHALIAMPFADDFEDVFHYGISNAVREGGLLCERIDKQAFTGDILSRLKDRIANAKLVVADLTLARPNVFLEVGYAWGCGVPTVLLCKDGDELEFDVQGQRCLHYKSIKDLEQQLTAELKALVP